MLNGISAAFAGMHPFVPISLLLLNNGFVPSMNWDVTLYEVMDATRRPIT